MAVLEPLLEDFPLQSLTQPERSLRVSHPGACALGYQSHDLHGVFKLLSDRQKARKRR